MLPNFGIFKIFDIKKIANTVAINIIQIKFIPPELEKAGRGNPRPAAVRGG